MIQVVISVEKMRSLLPLSLRPSIVCFQIAQACRCSRVAVFIVIRTLELRVAVAVAVAVVVLVVVVVVALGARVGVGVQEKNGELQHGD